MNVNIAICDDNIGFINQLRNYIDEYAVGYDGSYKISCFTSGEKLFSYIQRNFTPDIIFLDVDLREMALGTDWGAKIKKLIPNVLLIYVSSYTEYYQELVMAEPFRFLLKPIDLAELHDALDSAIKRLYFFKEDFIFTYKTNHSLEKVNLKKIMYFESNHRLIHIYMSNGITNRFYDRLDNVELKIEKIYPYFLRINKSYYVNYHYVKNFSSISVSINGMEIKVSPKYKKRYTDKMHFLL